MKSFMELNDNIEFEKNIDILSKGVLLALPKLTNEKFDYLFKNIHNVSTKKELVEQLVFNFKNVFPEYIIKEMAVPANALPANQPPSTDSNKALAYIKANFLLSLNNFIDKYVKNTETTLSGNPETMKSVQNGVNQLKGFIDRIILNMKQKTQQPQTAQQQQQPKTAQTQQQQPKTAQTQQQQPKTVQTQQQQPKTAQTQQQQPKTVQTQQQQPKTVQTQQQQQRPPR